MSSGTNETSLINGGVTSLTVEMPSSPQHVTLEQFKQGIQSIDEYRKYLALLQTNSEFNPTLFEPLFKTLDSTVLNSIGESQEFGKIIKQLLDTGCSSWNEDMIKLLLKIMSYLPLDLDVLIKNSLGFGVKNIKKNALEKNSVEIVELTNALIEKWKVLQKKAGLNANDKRNSPDRSSSASPPSSNEPPTKKQIKLAIQKEPPARPKAMADPNFLSSLRESKKYPNTRPIYNVDKILEGLGNRSVKSSTDMSLSLKRAATTELGNLSAPDSSKKKRVRFKDDLFEIREYEKNPEEWTSFGNNGKHVEHQYGNARDLDVKEGQNAFVHFPQIAWYTPLELYLDEGNPNSTLNIRSLIQTDESLAQDDREKLALAAIYTSPQHIPPSPAEPDETPNLTFEDSVSIIPLDDTESFTPTTATPTTLASTASTNSPSFSQPPPPPSLPTPSHSSIFPPTATVSTTPAIQPNLITTATLNAAIAAIKEQSSFMIPQQQQQYTQNTAIPTGPASSTVNYYNQPFTAAAAPKAPQSTTLPTTPATGTHNQPAISNETVETMLKNNPGIMQSLKQLSFLAAGNIINNNNTVPPAATQHRQSAPPYHPYQQPSNKQHFQQEWNRKNDYMNDMQQQQRKKPKTRPFQKPRQVRGNNGRMPTICNFYNSPEGCRYGDSCSFLHQ